MSYGISDYPGDYEGVLRATRGLGKCPIHVIRGVAACVGFHVSNQQIAEFYSQ